MTIRKLPAAPVMTRHANVSSEISQLVLDRWNPDVRSAAQTDNNVISIMDFIGSDFFGEGITAKRVSGALRSIGNKPVVVEINSPGGDYFEGLAIYNVLREHPKSVTVKVLGLAASAAAIIAMAGDEIMVPRAGFLMIHNTWVLAIGDRNDLRDVADFLEPFDKMAADLISARSGLPAKEVAKMLDVETWIGGEEAVEKGLADSLLPSDEVKEVPKKAVDAPVAAARRIEAALAKGERLPRSERRKLIKEISGTPSAAGEDGTPSAADTVDNDGNSGLRVALARLKLARA